MGFNPDNTPSPIRFTPRKDGGYKSPDDVNTRPAGDPRATKDFKKVLAKTDEEEEGKNAKSRGVEDAAAQNSLVQGTAGKKKGRTSLFDLTSGVSDKKKTEKESDLMASIQGKKAQSTSDDEDLSMDTKGKDLFEDASSAQTAAAPQEKNKFTTRFATEQTDLSYVNPMAAIATQRSVETHLVGKKEPVPTVNLQAIIDQIVDKVVELKVNDRTETTITLKHPPLFKDASIIVTSFDSAKREFNISIENLTQAAKNILDMQVNRDSLLLSLEKKGYAVHILATTTVSEPRTIIAEAQPSENRERRQPDQQGREQRRGG